MSFKAYGSNNRSERLPLRSSRTDAGRSGLFDSRTATTVPSEENLRPAAWGLRAACTPGRPRLHSAAGLAQGTTYSLQWSGGPADIDEVERAAGTELDRLDALLSNYRADSTIEQFNATHSVEPLELPAEL